MILLFVFLHIVASLRVTDLDFDLLATITESLDSTEVKAASLAHHAFKDVSLRELDKRRNITQLCGLEGLKLVSPARARFLSSFDRTINPSSPYYSPSSTLFIQKMSLDCISYLSELPKATFPHITSILISGGSTSLSRMPDTFRHLIDKLNIKQVIIEDVESNPSLACFTLFFFKDRPIKELVLFGMLQPIDDTTFYQCYQKFAEATQVSRLVLIDFLEEYHTLLTLPRLQNLTHLDNSHTTFRTPPILAYTALTRYESVGMKQHTIAVHHDHWPYAVDPNNIWVHTYPRVQRLKLVNIRPDFLEAFRDPAKLPNLREISIETIYTSDHKPIHLEQFVQGLLVRKSHIKSVSININSLSSTSDQFFTILSQYLSNTIILESFQIHMHRVPSVEAPSLSFLESAKFIKHLGVITVYHDHEIQVLSDFVRRKDTQLESVSLHVKRFMNRFNTIDDIRHVVMSFLSAVISNERIHSVELQVSSPSGIAAHLPIKTSVQFLKFFVHDLKFVIKDLKRPLLFNGFAIRSFVAELEVEFKYWPQDGTMYRFGINL